MSPKLYARTYLKNNKKRVTILIISLTLSAVLNYLTSFMLSVSSETVEDLCCDVPGVMQYMSYNNMGIVIGDEEYDSYSDAVGIYNEKLEKLGKKIENDCDKVKKVYCAESIYGCVRALFVTWYFEGALLPSEDIADYLEYYDAKLIEGRMPEGGGEVLLDSATIKNNGSKVGDPLKDYEKDYIIVGVVESEYNLICGTPNPDVVEGDSLFIFSDGIEDLQAELREIGLEITEDDVYWSDYKTQERNFQKDLVDVIDSSSQIIYVGIVILICIALSIIYTTFLRDRHSEWCLYASIGYSGKAIYFSILRELLFTFAVALAAGAAVTSLSVVLIGLLYLTPNGLKCRYIDIGSMGQIAENFLIFFAILQIPIRYALYRIKTIDTIDDDLN